MKNSHEQEGCALQKSLSSICHFPIHKLRHLVGGRGEYVKRWHKITKGKVGVWNGSKKDDVIHEQPLSYVHLVLGWWEGRKLRVLQLWGWMGGRVSMLVGGWARWPIQWKKGLTNPQLKVQLGWAWQTFIWWFAYKKKCISKRLKMVKVPLEYF